MKLNEFYGEWSTNGIFKNLENIGLEWDLDDYSILDIEYIGGRSGMKEINPLLNNLVRNDNRYQIVTNIIKVRFLQKWNKLYATLSFNYNPISNYDMTESSSDTNVNTSTAEGTSSSEGKVSAFNTNTYENDNKVEGSNNNSVSSIGTITHTMTRSGNIGTTTSQSMVMSERSVLMWNYFEQVFADLDDLLCLKVYGEVDYVAASAGLNRDEVQRLINSTLEDGGYTTEEDVEDIIDEKLKPINIIFQPVDATGLVGEIVTFSTDAEGYGLNYRWQASSDGINWSDVVAAIGGYRDKILQLYASSGFENAMFRCEISNVTGDIAYTDVAYMHVEYIRITSQPEDAYVPVNTRAYFTIVAEGADITYQWQYKRVGEEWADSSASTAFTDEFSVNARSENDDMQVRCKLTSGTHTLTSESATLHITLTSSITSDILSIDTNVTDISNLKEVDLDD